MSTDLIIQGDEWRSIKEQGEIMMKSGFLPRSIKDVNALLTIVMMGRELGVSPMAAINNISVINGKPCIEAKLMLAMVFRKYPNAHYRMLESNPRKAVIEIARPGQKPSIFAWSIDDAKTAGLLSKDIWHKYPTDMLMARVISRAVRQVFPEVIINAPYTVEEMEDVRPTISVTPQDYYKRPDPLPPPPIVVKAPAFDDADVAVFEANHPRAEEPPMQAEFNDGDVAELAQELDLLDARKTDMIMGVHALVDKVDFQARLKKSPQQIINKIMATKTAESLDKIESILVDLEMNSAT